MGKRKRGMGIKSSAAIDYDTADGVDYMGNVGSAVVKMGAPCCKMFVTGRLAWNITIFMIRSDA